MPTTGQTALVKLASQLGADAAAERLGISPSLMRRFLTNTLEVPDAVLLRAVDLIAEDTPVPQEKGSTPTPTGPGTA